MNTGQLELTTAIINLLWPTINQTIKPMIYPNIKIHDPDKKTNSNSHDLAERKLISGGANQLELMISLQLRVVRLRGPET